MEEERNNPEFNDNIVSRYTYYKAYKVCSKLRECMRFAQFLFVRLGRHKKWIYINRCNVCVCANSYVAECLSFFISYLFLCEFQVYSFSFYSTDVLLLLVRESKQSRNDERNEREREVQNQNRNIKYVC